MRRRSLAAVVLFLLPVAAYAKLDFKQLSKDEFLVFHQKTSQYGGPARAIKKLYEEVASLCIALGFTHFSSQEERQMSRQVGFHQRAGAMMRTKLSCGGSDDGILCQPLASPKKIATARKKIAKLRIQTESCDDQQREK